MKKINLDLNIDYKQVGTYAAIFAFIAIASMAGNYLFYKLAVTSKSQTPKNSGEPIKKNV
jgi:hypothetical protein